MGLLLVVFAVMVRASAFGVFYLASEKGLHRLQSWTTHATVEFEPLQPEGLLHRGSHTPREDHLSTLIL